MHVLFVTPTFPPENGWGGIGTYVHHLSLIMANAGCETTVLCDTKDAPRDYVRRGVRICRYLSSASINPIDYATDVADAIESLHREKHIDVVEFPEFGANGVVFQRRHPAFPVVVRLHGDTALCRQANGPRWKRFARKLIPPPGLTDIDQLERESVYLAHLVTAPSDWQVLQCLIRKWKFRQAPIAFPNPYHLSGGEYPLRQQRSSATVVHLARLDYRKGADLLPAILSRVWSAIPEAQFELIGQDQGRRRTSWKEWILANTPARCHRQLTFRGGVPYERIQETLRKHSIAFFGSVWESFSYTLVECMSEGLACVNGSVGGAQEVGIHDKSVINTPRNPEGIAHGIVRLLKDSRLRETLSQNAPERIRQFCGDGTVARNGVSAYRNAVRSARALNEPKLSGAY